MSYNPEKVNEILAFFKEGVESRKVLNPELWSDAALKLNLYRGDEEGLLHELRRKVSEKKVSLLDQMEKKNVSEVELRVAATKEYEEMKNQETRCEQIEEFIRLSKLNQRTAQGI